MAAGAILPNTGLTELLTSGTANFDKLAVGQGTTTPTLTDTAVEDQTDSVNVGAVTVNGNIATIEALLTTSDGNPASGELSELAALKSDGTLLPHLVISPTVPKDNTQGLIVSIVLTLANA